MILKIEYQYTSLTGNQSIIGAYNGSKYQLIGNNGNNFIFIQYGTPYKTFTANTNKSKIIVDFVNNGFTINSTKYDLLWAENRQYLNDFYLFWANSVNDGRAKAKIKLYNLEIYRGEELSLHLIPCLDKNGTPLMYDTVSKTPFYNQGTGEFLYG